MVGALAWEYSGVSRIWTNSILREKFAGCQIAAAKRHRAMAWLHLLGFTTTIVTDEAMLCVFQEMEWNLEDSMVLRMLDWCGLPELTPHAVIQVALGVLPVIWQKAPMLRRDGFINAICKRIGGRRDAKRMLAAILVNIDQACGIDVFAARGIKEVVSRWNTLLG